MNTYHLDPALASYVAESEKFTSKTEALSDRRDAFAQACAYFTPQKPEGVIVEDHLVGGIALRTYLPGAVAPADGWPAILYFHGGGWNMGSHKTHDWFSYALIRRIDVAIVAIDYRLAPEHPFPAPLEDGLEVWFALRRGELPKIDRRRICVAGDSAGGTLAAGLCVALKEQGEEQPVCQALVYPVLTDSEELRSMEVHANAPMLTAAGLAVSLGGYVPTEKLRNDRRALALKNSDLVGLAPAFIGVAEFDPLFDHGVEYATRLKLASVGTDLHIGQGLVHASLRASGVVEVEKLYDALAESIDRSLISARCANS
jgi:acetyl esterase